MRPPVITGGIDEMGAWEESYANRASMRPPVITGGIDARDRCIMAQVSMLQ